MLGIRIIRCIASVPSYFAEFSIVKNELPIEEEITNNNIIKSLQLATKDNIMPDREVVTIIPIDFTTDNGSTKDPIGSKSSKLLSRSIMVTTPKKILFPLPNYLIMLALNWLI